MAENTLVNPQNNCQKSPTYFAATRSKPRGPAHYVSQISVRRELERVYKELDGWHGLCAWAKTVEGKSRFYEMFMKLLATYEIKAIENAGSVKVIIYGNDAPAAGPLELPMSSTPQPVVSHDIENAQVVDKT